MRTLSLALASLAIAAALSSPAQAATPVPTFICPTAATGSPAPACSVPVVCAVPAKGTDMVRTFFAVAPNTQVWEPYSTLTASSNASSCTGVLANGTKGTWSTLTGLAIPVFSSVTPPPVATQSLTISWVAPTQNTDGTALTNLGAFNVYQGATVNTLLKVGSVAAGVLTWKTPPLTAGVYWFAVTAVTTVPVESGFSDKVSGTVQQVVLTPNAPTNLTVK